MQKYKLRLYFEFKFEFLQNLFLNFSCQIVVRSIKSIRMNPFEIIEKYYDKESKLYEILISHCKQVSDKALQIAQKHPELGADKQFLKEAAMLHDIGIYLCNAPEIECFGSHQYIEHGYLGSEILCREGLPKHALVCERHTGLGLSQEWIEKRNLPVPHRDMKPVSIEEQIICYTDKYYSKSRPENELPVEKILKKLGKYDESQVSLFRSWMERFE